MNNLDEKIRNLKKSIGEIPLSPPEPTRLVIEEVDVSGWDEFATVGGGSFFDKPMSKSLIFQTGYPQNMILDCSFFSVVSADKQTAINTLRRDLLFIKNLWPKIKVAAFLAKPSVIELKTEAKPNEMADCVTYVDLRGPVPAVRKWAAFCFLHAYEESYWDYNGRYGYKQLSVDDWKKMGLPSAVLEGQVGYEVPANDQLFTAAADQDPGWPDEPFIRGMGAMPPGPDKLNPIKVKGEPVVLSEPLDAFDPLAAGGLDTELEIEPQPYHDQKLTTLTAAGETQPAKIIGALHPEIAAAAEKHGIDLGKPAGRELQEMRKYFGSGSGLYIATVDFQTASVRSTLLTEEAQKRIFKALNDSPKPKRKRKSAKKPIKKSKVKRLTRRRSRR